MPLEVAVGLGDRVMFKVRVTSGLGLVSGSTDDALRVGVEVSTILVVLATRT